MTTEIDAASHETTATSPQHNGIAVQSGNKWAFICKLLDNKMYMHVILLHVTANLQVISCSYQQKALCIISMQQSYNYVLQFTQI